MGDPWVHVFVAPYVSLVGSFSVVTCRNHMLALVFGDQLGDGDDWNVISSSSDNRQTQRMSR